ncbi:MAG TPA: 2-oxoglutarate dehydrogenase complex dihydrolipoyllysine-residue succinyltransferase [Terriglobia bacterium]|nr:2-oxoglutarate dehydrogenase complex dihydrolipoyllysine-residue succinyltransferase [Terriglobia bacterium]
MPAKIVVPELGESVVEATVGRWLKKQGDRVAVGEPVVALETEKVDLEVGAEHSGVLARIERQEGEDVKIGDVLGLIEESDGAKAAPTEAGKASAKPAATPETASIAVPPAAQEPPDSHRNSVTPLARRVAEAHGVDVAQIQPGDGGRVRQRDVENYIAGRQPGAAQPAAPPVQTTGMAPREERIRMSRRRQTIARRLVEAQHTAAMLTTFNEVDMTAVMELRRSQKEEFEKRHGVGLGVTSFFVKAAIGALKDFPRLNAEIQGEEIVLKHYFDIGVAVGASEGLVVPVLRDADRMSFAEIEKGIKDFAQRAEEGTLTLQELRGGTFTITNGGVFRSLLSTPILNPPQVGILGLHKIQERAVPHQGQVAIRPMMYVALSYDHRIVDGREAVQFLVRVKQFVEDPGKLLLQI